jgi:hypothetical protein
MIDLKSSLTQILSFGEDFKINFFEPSPLERAG